jgi:hypothetical protein
MTRLKQNKIATAYHEAGHYVTARHFGVPVYAWLHLDKRDDKGGDKFKLWTGRCDTQDSRDLLSDHQERIHSVAGAIAQIAWEFKTADQDMPNWTVVLDFMSPSDCTLNGLQHDLATVSEREWQKWWKAMVEAHAMLNRENGPLWPTVQRVARRLLTSERNYIQLNRRESAAASQRLVNHWVRKGRRERKAGAAP